MEFIENHLYLCKPEYLGRKIQDRIFCQIFVTDSIFIEDYNCIVYF
ncbi:hypothetical protein LEP1GSC018_4095 [Leptospira kirschneri str. 2008720114]|uniref:Uncharacterized protein n=1 Tax=Leptospira kirschneri str. 200802841 TaxID=1193047 RepID=A0A828Y5Y3_9LEPT|nr:hypothetical protein LEP1GSC131_1185 [Leptospira kirschneri str. 200802841]EKP04104.1 hypothetical protein LEP1GSC018_4095 [Leptospira kirschneri str. 2008720114]